MSQSSFFSIIRKNKLSVFLHNCLLRYLYIIVYYKIQIYFIETNNAVKMPNKLKK